MINQAKPSSSVTFESYLIFERGWSSVTFRMMYSGWPSFLPLGESWNIGDATGMVVTGRDDDSIKRPSVR